MKYEVTHNVTYKSTQQHARVFKIDAVRTLYLGAYNS